MRRRNLGLVAAGVVAALGLATPAYAFFSAGATTSGTTASSASLTAPAITAATPSVVNHAGQVALTWRAAGMPAAFTFSVTRDGESAGGTCAGSLPSTTTSCTDSAVTAGPHSYQVSATLTADSAWTASSATTSATVPHDYYFVLGNVPPSATAGQPMAGITVTARDGSGLDMAWVDKTGDVLSISGTLNGAQAPSVSPDPVSFDGRASTTVSVTLVAPSSGPQSFTISDATHSGTASVQSVDAPAVSAPTITSPSSATPKVFSHQVSGQTLAVTGTGFGQGATVTISDPAYVVTAVAWNSATSLTVTVSDTYTNSGTHAANLTVTNPDSGSATSVGAVQNK
jgi:hypothetical protein